MNTTPDPMQEWAGFWLKEQQQYWQRWAQSHNPPSAPVDFTAMAVQAWQKGNELWLDSLRATLPGRLAEPITAILKQSQEDLHQAFQAGQALQQPAGQSKRAGTSATRLDPGSNSQHTALDFDPGRLSRDPDWCEYVLALNGFIQFHIQMTVESLSALKAELISNSGHDPDTLLENQLHQLLSDYQAKLQSRHYRKLLERLTNSLAAMPGK